MAFAHIPGLLLWNAFGFLVTLPLLSWLVFSGLKGRRRIEGILGTKSLIVLASAFVLSAFWQFSNPTYGADYQAAGSFADVLLKYGSSFYVVEGALTTTSAGLPAFSAAFEHNYVYGPVSVLIASSIRALPLDWAALYRSLLVLFNLITGSAILAWLGGRRGLVGCCLFLFNPLLYYTLNAGLNDSIMIGFLTTGLLLVYKGRSLSGGVAMGLSLMTKQNAVFVAIPVLAWLYFRDKPRFMRFLSGLLVAGLAVSLPFLLTSQTRTAYFEAVFEYPLALSIQGKTVVAGQLVSGLPNIGFSGLWSALRSLGFSDQTFFLTSPFVEIFLMIAAVFLASKRRTGLTDVSMLGYSTFLLGSKYLWNNHFVAFLPLAILSLLTVSASKFRVPMLSALVGGGLLYVILDGYAYLIGAYPPDYLIPDLVFFTLLCAFFLWQAKGTTGSLARKQHLVPR